MSIYGNYLEESNNDKIDVKIQSAFILIFHHMLKYMVQQNRQTKSWMGTILREIERKKKYLKILK